MRLVFLMIGLLSVNLYFGHYLNKVNQSHFERNSLWIDLLSDYNQVNLQLEDLNEVLAHENNSFPKYKSTIVKEKLLNYLNQKMANIENNLIHQSLTKEQQENSLLFKAQIQRLLKNNSIGLSDKSNIADVFNKIKELYINTVEGLKIIRQSEVYQQTVQVQKVILFQNIFNILMAAAILWFIYYGFRIAIIAGRVQKRKILVKKINTILLSNGNGEEMIDRILEVMCSHFNWKLGLYWNVENNQLQLLRKWTKEHQFSVLSEGMGHCDNDDIPFIIQKVIKIKDATWIRDFLKEKNENRIESARRASVRGGIAFPIIVNDEILGVIELYNDQVEPTDILYLEECSQIGMHIAEVFKRNRTEMELKEALRIAADKQYAIDMSAIVGITDIHGKITYVNDKFCDVTGFSRDELIGSDHRVLNSKFHSPDFFEKMWETILSGQVWRGEIKNRRKDGTFYWSDSTIVPMRNSYGRVSQFIAIRYDITDSKNNQELLINAKEVAESAAKIKSDFLANMSHEIRTPMNAIIGITDLLTETNLTEEQKRYVDIFRKAGKSLLGIIDDILDSAKIESGQFKLANEEIDLVEIVEEVSDITSASAFHKGLNFVCHYYDDFDHHFLGDSLRLKQVLTNLLTNAIKFTTHGEIVLSMAYNHKTDKKGNVLFCVKDTGNGISAEKLIKLFQPFTQADSSVTKKYGGTGLGLSLSKHLVEIMGGEMWVDSVEGSGSEFYFTVQFEQLAQTSKIHQFKLDHFINRKVLIVDSSDTSRRIIRQHLENLKMEAVEAINYDIAEEMLMKFKLSNQEFNYVFVDYRLKGDKDGVMLAQLIKTHFPNIRTVLLSFDGLPIFRSKYRENGIHGLMYKPFKKTDLFHQLEQLENQKSYTMTEYEITEFLESKIEKSEIHSKPLQILLVDDSDDNRTLVKSFLKRTNHKIIEVTDGKKAVAMFEEVKFDIILMDIQMPIMDGYQATRQIRQIEKERGLHKTPIIALTAYALKEDYERCIAAGCDMHISKPVRKNILIDNLNKITATTLIKVS